MGTVPPSHRFQPHRYLNAGLAPICNRQVIGEGGIDVSQTRACVQMPESRPYAYDPFGGLRSSTGTFENPYLFAGEAFDPVVGTYYLRARDMDPGTGRFVSRDGFGGFAGVPLSTNRYLYAQADPVNNVDPSGHWIANALIAGIGLGLIDFGAFTALFGFGIGEGSNPFSGILGYDPRQGVVQVFLTKAATWAMGMDGLHGGGPYYAAAFDLARSNASVKATVQKNWPSCTGRPTP
jgi:RHS repeat-associated protein